MRYNQKKAGNIIEIELKDDALHYSIQDKRSKGKRVFYYENIPNQSYELFESNLAMRTYAIYLLIIGSVFFLASILFDAPVSGVLLLIGAPICYLFYLRSKVNFTVIETNDGNIYVIQDLQHKEIIDAIYGKRNAYLKQKYAVIEVENDSLYEINKFRWLKDMGVISEAEYEGYVSMLSGSTNNSDPILQ